MVDKKGKRPLETRSTRRRYNEEHSDAEEIEWQSDDETEEKPKAISELLSVIFLFSLLAAGSWKGSCRC